MFLSEKYYVRVLSSFIYIESLINTRETREKGLRYVSDMRKKNLMMQYHNVNNVMEKQWYTNVTESCVNTRAKLYK